MKLNKKYHKLISDYMLSLARDEADRDRTISSIKKFKHFIPRIKSAIQAYREVFKVEHVTEEDLSRVAGTIYLRIYDELPDFYGKQRLDIYRYLCIYLVAIFDFDTPAIYIDVSGWSVKFNRCSTVVTKVTNVLEYYIANQNKDNGDTEDT